MNDPNAASVTLTLRLKVKREAWTEVTEDGGMSTGPHIVSRIHVTTQRSGASSPA
jgi:hypothetical protein